MSVKMRIEVEHKICEAIVSALVDAGFSVSIDNGDNNGKEYEIQDSTDKADIQRAMFKTDEERLFVNRTTAAGAMSGWVYLVYGNDGYDVMSDYTTNLEPFIGKDTTVDKLIDRYAD